MKDIKAVLFDLDDTILDRGKTFAQYCEFLLDSVFHQDLSADQRLEAMEFMISNDKRGYEDREVLWSKTIRRYGLSCPTKQLVDSWYLNVDKFAAPEDGLIEVMEYLAPKYKLGLVTNGLISIQSKKIDAIGVRDRFQTILISEAVGVNKPNRAIFLLACKNLGVDAAQSVFIGDHYDNDVQGAVQAGLSAVWMNKSGSDKPYPYKIRKLTDILKIL